MTQHSCRHFNCHKKEFLQKGLLLCLIISTHLSKSLVRTFFSLSGELILRTMTITEIESIEIKAPIYWCSTVASN